MLESILTYFPPPVKIFLHSEVPGEEPLHAVQGMRDYGGALLRGSTPPGVEIEGTTMRGGDASLMKQLNVNGMVRLPLPMLLIALLALSAAPEARGAAADDSAILNDRQIVQPDTLRTESISLLRLGMDQLEQGDPQLARQTFNRALEINPRDARIHLGIGRSYLDRKARKLRILEIIERLFAQDYLSKAIRSLETAVELDPDSWEAHFWLGSAHMRRHDREDLERAREHLTIARRLGGDNRDLRFRLALLHKALGDIDNAEQILSQLIGQGAPADPLADLELTKIQIARQNLSEAVRYYWAGLKGISTREEAQAFFDDIVMLASPQEKKQFGETPPERAMDFFRTFWFARDHQLGLSPGVRLVRHYQRLQVADSLYRVPFGVRNPAITVAAEYYPDESVPYDDRGIIYIRHGAPDLILTHSGEEIYPNQTWIYRQRGRQDFIVHFAALNGNQEYQLLNALDGAVRKIAGMRSMEARQELYSSRTEVGRGLYFRLANDPDEPFVRMEEYEHNIQDLSFALRSETVDRPYAQSLASFYDLVEFRGHQRDKSLLEFYAGVPGREITYRTRPDGYMYDLYYQLVLYDRNWQLVDQVDRNETITSRVNPHDLMDKLVVGLGQVELQPGSYRYFVKIKNGEAVGNYNGEITVDAFDGDSLQASEILTAGNIVTSAAESGKFKRFNLEVHPNPSRTFHPSEKVYAYQEIYNLKQDSQGNYNYRLTYAITSLKRDRNVFGKLLGAFRTVFGAGEGRERVVLAVDKKKVPVADRLIHEDVAIDISRNPEGLYELSIKVEDLNDLGRMFKRNTQFIIKK